ncbi:hypothetical protein BFO01nite_48190 [Brevibacillus formosus]|uniref:Uncharacterized protein n=1 Tax=Brevibacillus formosus TaxID=54913 RepID=A0ABQ0TBK1_9BACL|nr:hypothetical protein BFO01nite_48190 [Brevibacillus formosus]
MQIYVKVLKQILQNISYDDEGCKWSGEAGTRKNGEDHHEKENNCKICHRF